MKRAGKYWVPDQEQLQIEALSQGPWQVDHLDAALEFCGDRRGCAVDGGAHVGSWTLHMAEKGFRHIEAFEPSQETFDCLKENCKEWRLENRNRQTYLGLNRCALGEEISKMGMKDDGKYAGGNTGGRHLKGDGDIDVRPLDIYKLVDVDFLKLDLEGFELFALRGARETLIQWQPVVLLEVKHRMAHRYGYQPGAPTQFLLDLGMIELGSVGSDFFYGWR